MERILLRTADGSHTLHIPEWDEQYHSKHGAIAEALHVFIKEGLQHRMALHQASEICIMEIGFGTGLNAFLTYLESEKQDTIIRYTGIEAYPLGIPEIEKLNYSTLLKASEEKFREIHKVPWEQTCEISPKFELLKKQQFFSDIKTEDAFHLIFFDAFGIRVQPHLWTESIFQTMFTSLKKGGTLVTYAANGNARRAMQSVGFSVERLPGPPGKKEMLRATKT